MEYKDKIFRMHYENRRLLIKTENFTNLIDDLLDSNPIPAVSYANNLRKRKIDREV
jgi:hypothetical protein